MPSRQTLTIVAFLATIVQTTAAAATMQPIWLAGALGIWLFVIFGSEPSSDQTC